MNGTTTTTTTRRTLFKKGERIDGILTSGPRVWVVLYDCDSDEMATMVTVRAARWYDHLRWWARAVPSRARAAVVRLFARATP